LRDEWISRFPRKHVNPNCSETQSSEGENDLIEVIKYGSKITVRELDKKSRNLISPMFMFQPWTIFYRPGRGEEFLIDLGSTYHLRTQVLLKLGH